MKNVLTESPFHYPVLKYRVIDGDTVEVVADTGWGSRHEIDVRINGVDTPESRTRNALEKQAGKLITQRVELWCSKAELADLRVVSYEWGKYGGRCLGDLYIAADAKQPLSAYLLKNGYAREYLGDARGPWTDAELNRIIGS